jgi:hypothetical protein
MWQLATNNRFNMMKRKEKKKKTCRRVKFNFNLFALVFFFCLDRGSCLDTSWKHPPKKLLLHFKVSIFNGELKREKTEHSFVRVTTQNRKVTHKEINQKNEERNAQTNKDVKLRLFFHGMSSYVKRFN